MPSGLAAFAEVALPVAVHGTFTYAIPHELRDSVRLGSRVEVPFGAKRTTGFVVGFVDSAPAKAAKIKLIRAVLDDDEPALVPEIIELCRWAAEYYIAPMGEMLRMALPANMSARGRRELVLIADDALITRGLEARQILDADLALVDALRLRPLAFDTALEVSTRSAIARLRDAGIVSVGDRLRDAVGVRYDRFVVLETTPGGLTPKQESAVALLRARGGETTVRALEHAGAGAAVLSKLVQKGVVRLERRPRRHTLDAFLAGLDAGSVAEFRFSSEQRDAIESIRRALGTFAPFLLEGVT